VSATHPLDLYLAALHYNSVVWSVGIPDRLEPSPVVLASGRFSPVTNTASATPIEIWF
jgi:hypothetical protein